jgi:tetratricopeptide (TPR) repeat protein
MDTSTEKTASSLVGARIRVIRQQKKLTQKALAGSEFSKGYVSALERGAVRPSFKALEVFARRLGVPVSDLLSTTQELSAEPDLKALQEDLIYQANYAKMLIRTGQVQEAFQLLDEMEKSAQPYKSSLSNNVAYLVPFLRGRAYLQVLAPNLARPELEAALEIARNDPEAVARVRNLLGVVFYEQSQPRLALEQHLLCLESIKSHVIGDLNFRVNVYRNVANDYWAMSEPRQAIGVYEEVLPLLDDLNDLQQQAMVFWGMASAYMMSQDWPRARLFATRALHIYEASDNRAEAASICLNLAETLIEDQRYDEATELLERADRLLAGTGNRAVLSYLHRYYADLARHQGQHEKALSHARQSVDLAQAYHKATQSTGEQARELSWQDPIRIYAEALEVEALIEEDQGQREAADRLFEQALALIESAGFEETRHRINLSYAKVMQARGDFENATNFYRIAAELLPYTTRRGT